MMDSNMHSPARTPWVRRRVRAASTSFSTEVRR